MKILVLTQIIPYPPDAGPRVKTWHVLRYLLSRGHQVLLASFVRPEEEPYLPALREAGIEVYTVPLRRSRLADVYYYLRSQWTRRPFLIERDDLPAMRALVQRLVENEGVDAIHADQLGMAQFALPYRRQSERGARLIFDAHNAVWSIIERMRENAPWFFKPVIALEAARVKRHEGEIVRRFDHTLAVTEPDRLALLEAVQAAGGDLSTPPDITVTPIAVDTQQLRLARRDPAAAKLLTLGTLHYLPNADGIRWFGREVFPLVRRQIPQASLTIIGKNPPADFLQMAAHDPQAITVTGYVPDLDPYMDAATIMVVAVRAGGGMRVRILEAFARGMPVVTTTVGLEGIAAEPGVDVLVADTPETFAAEVVRLLNDPDLQAALAARGRLLAERCYDWQVILQKMDRVFAR